MPVDATLRRAAEEVARGDLASVLRARQRLVGLVCSYPARLDLRDRLASVYRLLGDPVQAGRWSYLLEVRDEAELAAFERAYRTPESRLAAMNWLEPEGGPDGAAGSETARDRLTDLRRAVAEQLAGELAVTEDRDSPWHVHLGVLVGVVVVLLCFVVGLVTVVMWLLGWATA
ncbi:hypothetical protein KCV87_25695 [Actinosynnema pretiosum subsp. pretiosum]|uniref:Uncharacterized protein n=2 Tax=Actinosynnema TaxID=40566 RepID=C6WG87_ACTMD|nr:DUF6584 family protein [Actinosynnema mirum]ACU39851.1 conserved hypothetical protein [Actinosynnema mirum DSM 43827]AXX33366.1 hypothetical protein APASM_6001 [Actinosynnema pretiosum subsp. pretiosum]QUF02816.1 hypothetical protein KCV87_25695 [Actinosynnema pretiosum subsp. pretiosum]